VETEPTTATPGAEETVAPPPIRFLYRDEAMVIVDKPAGLVCHRTEIAPDRDVVMTRVRDQLGAYVYPVHRLDRGTSGALVFTLSSETARSVRESFDAGLVQKTYLALARGHLPGLVGERLRVDYAIPKAEGSKVRVPAVTTFEKLGEGEHASLVIAFPETGRFHQIRRHLAHLRHPLAVDSAYGTGWWNREIREKTGLLRLGLHAVEVTLPHPVTKQPVTARAPVPDDLRLAFDILGLGEALRDYEARAPHSTLLRT
jgi:tRNA pseudouridine65 synthase